MSQAVDSHAETRPAGGTGGSAALVGLVVGVLLCVGTALAVRSWTSSAAQRLVTPEAPKPKVAVADQAEVAYCTPQFKQVLERVLHSCGLAGGEGDRRGCKPTDVKTFASISDNDFNALFTPLKDRGGVVMFDEGHEELDDPAKKLLEERWFARKGARYFFVVARASKTGNQAKNRALSHRRANSVMYFLTQLAGDPEIEKKVGLLWLGNEFAQLDKGYCSWPNSRPDEKCDEEPINRSAFVSWVDLPTMSRQPSAWLLAALLVGCNTPDDKKPISAPLERSQVVEAKPGQTSTAAAPVTPAATSAAPKPPRALCAGQMSGPGRAAPKKPLSQNVASGEAALPEALPLGGGFTWVNFWAAWCKPCKEEIPLLYSFQQQLAKVSPGFKLEFISLDDDERQLVAFLAGQPASGGLRRSYWLKEGKEREDWLKVAGLDADPELPFHLLFDAKGKLRCVVKGALEDSDLPALKALVSP